MIDYNDWLIFCWVKCLCLLIIVHDYLRWLSILVVYDDCLFWLFILNEYFCGWQMIIYSSSLPINSALSLSLRKTRSSFFSLTVPSIPKSSNPHIFLISYPNYFKQSANFIFSIIYKPHWTKSVEILPNGRTLLVEVGPLLQTLLLAGPVPQWQHPPPQLKRLSFN